MCTLTIAWQVFSDAPVAVAANRDEAYGRPSEPPAVREGEPRTFAPRDARAGGTWIGYNEHDVFVGVTNRWVEGLAAERSRGLLVRDCLAQTSASEAIAATKRELRDREYGGFNLVVADATTAALLEWDGELRVSEFDPGVHVVVNVGADGDSYEPPGRPELGERQANSARRVRDALAPRDGETAREWLARAGRVLGDHDYGVCVHSGAPEGDADERSKATGDDGERRAGDEDREDGYGTRSSSLILLGEERRYEFADGPPCRTPYRTVEGHL